MRYDNIDVINLMLPLNTDNYGNLGAYGNLALKIMYIRLTREFIYLPIKKEHPEYHLLKVYNKNIPDIDRLINKYLF